MNFKAETFSLGRTSPPEELGQWAWERGSWRTSDGLGDIRTEACIAPVPILGHCTRHQRGQYFIKNNETLVWHLADATKIIHSLCKKNQLERKRERIMKKIKRFQHQT